MNLRAEFEKVSHHNFHDLRALVEEQAFHHSCVYRGKDEKFIEAIERLDPVAKIIFMRDSSTQEPLGYILYNHLFGFKGKDLYIEDILVSHRQRGNGVGYALSERLKEIAREEKANYISWVVARDNDLALRFYREKMLAHPLPYGGYDCANLFLESELAYAPQYQVRELDVEDVPNIWSSLTSLGVSRKKIGNIEAAVLARHANVYVSLDRTGKPLAIGITNSNFSSFRTVYGYKLELLELDPNVEVAGDAFYSIVRTIAKLAHMREHTGHLNLFVDNNSAAQMDFAHKIGAIPLMMSDRPNSFLDPYAISEDVIYTQNDKFVLNASSQCWEPNIG